MPDQTNSIMKSLGQLKKNDAATFELQSTAYSKLKQLYPENPLIPNLKDDNIVWGALIPINATHVRQVVEVQKILGRSVLINSGGHGSKKGLGPEDDKQMGEGTFIIEDVQIAIQSNGIAGLHIVSPGSPPLHPPNIDVIISWCYGMSEINRDGGESEQPQEKLESVQEKVVAHGQTYNGPSEQLNPSDLLHAFLRVKPGLHVVEFEDAHHDRCNQMFAKLPLILFQLQKLPRDGIDSPKDWIEFIGILQHYNESLGLMIRHIDDFTFPDLQALYDTFKALEMLDEEDMDIKDCKQALKEFGGEELRGFWSGLLGTVGGVVGGIVGIGATILTEGFAVTSVPSAISAGVAVGSSLGLAIENREFQEEEVKGSELQGKFSWRTTKLEDWSEEQVMTWAREESGLPEATIEELDGMIGSDLVNYTVDDLAADLSLKKPIARRLFNKIQDLKAQGESGASIPPPESVRPVPIASRDQSTIDMITMMINNKVPHMNIVGTFSLDPADLESFINELQKPKALKFNALMNNQQKYQDAVQYWLHQFANCNSVEDVEKFAKVNKGLRVWPVVAPIDACIQIGGGIDNVLRVPIEDAVAKAKSYPYAKQIFKQSDKDGMMGKEIQWIDSDFFNSDEYREFDSFMVIGQTGCGKTTLINAMCNYLWGIEYKDPVRFKIVKDETSADTTVSQTVNITGYIVKPIIPGKRGYVIIDTPGFGDTEDRDDFFLDNLGQFFMTTSLRMKAICFCMKSTDNRCGSFLKHVIDSVLDVFDTNCLPNIMAMCTFASINDPECLPILKKEKINKWFKFDNQAIFPKEGHSLTNTGMAETMFKMAYEQYAEFFEYIDSVKEIEISGIQEIVQLRRSLQQNIGFCSQQITLGMSEHANVRRHVEVLSTNMDQIIRDPSKFYIDDDEAYFVTHKCNYGWYSKCSKCPDRPYCYGCSCVSSKYPGVTPVKTAEKTYEACKYPYWFPSPTYNCNQCTHSYYDHYSIHEYQEKKFKKVKKPATDLISKYQKEGDDISQIFVNAETKLKEISDKIEGYIDQSIEFTNRLQQIAIKPIPINKVQFIQEMIDVEMKKGSKRNENKLKKMEEMLKQTKLLVQYGQADKNGTKNMMKKALQMDDLAKNKQTFQAKYEAAKKRIKSSGGDSGVCSIF